MLYISTRNQNVQYTAPQTFASDRAPDGGFFVPMALQAIDTSEIASLMKKSFGENVAAVLSLLFPVRLTGWDVDCAIGRKAIRLHGMNKTVYVAECWHDFSGRYASVERSLYGLIRPDNAPEVPCLWPRIAIRAAVIFGIYALMYGMGIQKPNISMESDDFSQVMSAWYAAQLGLPMGKIICCTQETSGLWDLFKHGSCSGVAKKPECFEMLLREAASADAVKAYWNSTSHASFELNETDIAEISCRIHVSVVTKTRSNLVVGTVFASDSFIIDPDTAFAYGGIQDYRSESGTNHPSVLISDNNPMLSEEIILRATGLSHDELLKHLQKNGV